MDNIFVVLQIFRKIFLIAFYLAEYVLPEYHNKLEYLFG